ncbi:PAS domain S-box protein, partial [Trichloromonas sp.]|uniref:hybrid sensor histidine kinase/response regulator n=1 Tax=Trichloromonas sp. TaxID=3069249 RepID=UPI002A441BF2|nr:PAS domain S-box protein [Trichloromonas sp.]
NHIPIIILTNDLEYDILSDLIISDNISDKEFLYQVNTLLKMKLIDDELRKEQIVLELKVKERTNQLEDKANRLNITLNSIGDGVIVTDKNGYITLMNPVAKELTKLEDSDFMYKHIDEVFDITYKNNKINIYKEVIKTNKTFFIKEGSKLKSKDGNCIRISDSASLILNKNNNIDGIVIVFRDITTEYELRKRTIESEIKYRRIYYHVPDVVYTMSIDGTFTSMNDANIFGYKNDEIIGSNISKYIPYKDDLKKIQNNIRSKLVGEKKITEYEISLIKKNGDIVPINVKTQMVFDSSNNPVEIFGIVRDISDKVKTDKIIEESKDRYKNILDNMNNAVWVFKTIKGDDFYFIEWNKKSSCMDNKKEKDVIGKDIYEIFPNLIKDDFKNYLKNVWNNGKPIEINNFEFINNNKKTWRYFFIYKLSTTNELVVMVNDITSIKEYEEQLKQEKDRAEESDRLKSVFLANMSHEIRTPMNSIIGFSSLIDEKTPKNKLTEYINIINDSSNLLLTLIDDIIDLSKIQSGVMKIKKEPFNLNDLLNKSEKEYIELIKSKNKSNIKIEKNIPTKDIVINTDPKRLKQIINNLVGNAIKFTKNGKITFGYSVKNDNVIFFVKDTGIGISSENLPKIFDRFFQIENKNEKKQEGTGLGLTISKAIIEILGGKIWLESVIDKGTVFYFNLPVGDIKNVKKENKKIIKRKYKWNNKNLLIVEDDDDNYKLCEIVLEPTGINIERSKNCNEFYNLIKLKQYDVILMDTNLGDGNGNDLIKYIRDNNIKSYIITLSGYSSLDSEEESYKMGANFYMVKPIKWNLLKDKINEYLNSKN